MNINQFLKVSFFLLFSVAVILALVFNNAKSIRKEDVSERASIASIAAELLRESSHSATPIAKTIYVYPTSTSQPEVRVEKTERVETHEKETIREVPAPTSSLQPTQTPVPSPTPSTLCVLNVCL